ncbi:TPA: DUF454 family protein [Streptococcus pneumoniae]
MRLIYLIIGFLSLALAIVGVVLPLLPTTPFLLLSIACFSRSSKRFEDWLYHTNYFAPLLPVKIGLGALTIFITYYLFKVIPDKE